MFKDFELLFGQWKINDIPTIKLPEDAEKAFKAVVMSFPEMRSEPIVYCGSQLVNGKNYMIIYKYISQPRMEMNMRIQTSIIKIIINEQSGDYNIVSSEVLVSGT